MVEKTLHKLTIFGLSSYIVQYFHKYQLISVDLSQFVLKSLLYFCCGKQSFYKYWGISTNIFNGSLET